MQVCAKLKGRMMQSGTLMVGYQPDDRRPNFFRSVLLIRSCNDEPVWLYFSYIDRVAFGRNLAWRQ